ncbi:hypothetical protein RIVM261_079550 [Rivularia sp. IAM M-261]|nr:hypothetical protein RIVM261_079550 [Rivularia sp. IAM M-261]
MPTNEPPISRLAFLPNKIPFGLIKNKFAPPSTPNVPKIFDALLPVVASNKTHIKKSKASDVVIQEAPVTEVQLVSVAENKTENTNTAPVSETQLVNTVIEQTVPQGTNRHMQVRSEVTIIQEWFTTTSGACSQ